MGTSGGIVSGARGLPEPSSNTTRPPSRGIGGEEWIQAVRSSPQASGARSPIIDFHVHPGSSLSLERMRGELQRILQEARHHHLARICLSAVAAFGLAQG